MISIGNRKIGNGHPPFIIAELSGNHKGSLKRALKIIKKAKEIGASAVKLQTFDLNEMTINSKNKSFIINDKTSPWYKKNLYQLYKIDDFFIFGLDFLCGQPHEGGGATTPSSEYLVYGHPGAGIWESSLFFRKKNKKDNF